MNLSFKEYFHDKTPTFFVDQIWNGLYFNHISNTVELEKYMDAYIKRFRDINVFNSDGAIKLTSIREDKNDRWKAGNKIHFFINNRTKNMFRFAPVISCVSTQTIHITYHQKKYPFVWIDNRLAGFYRKDKKLVANATKNNINLETVIKNDGFPDAESFFNWFNKPFKGKIIHWTDLKY